MQLSQERIFNFKTDISRIEIPEKLNNPFSLDIPKIGQLAAQEFQDYITADSPHWDYNFDTQKGKMFGVLVIQKEDKSYGYLGTVSGKLPGNTMYSRFAPPVFIEKEEAPFLSIGLTELSSINNEIKNSNQESTIIELKKIRKLKSTALQQRLFENTPLVNIKDELKNVLEIFENTNHGYPPAASGECAAPKLLQFALMNNLKPLAIVEFWWGNPAKNNERQHKNFYPACKNKCRPILEYILDEPNLFENAKA